MKREFICKIDLNGAIDHIVFMAISARKIDNSAIEVDGVHLTFNQAFVEEVCLATRAKWSEVV